MCTSYLEVVIYIFLVSSSIETDRTALLVLCTFVLHFVFFPFSQVESTKKVARRDEEGTHITRTDVTSIIVAGAPVRTDTSCGKLPPRPYVGLRQAVRSWMADTTAMGDVDKVRGGGGISSSPPPPRTQDCAICCNTTIVGGLQYRFLCAR